MNEEEKQAIFEIEKLTAEIYIYMGIEKVRFYRDKYKTILNLIDKQQKEIEDYKECERLNKRHVRKLKNDIEALEIVHEAYKEQIQDIEKKYISKDKIREKIKELESHIWKDGYMTKFDKYAIHYLKELLGE